MIRINIIRAISPVVLFLLLTSGSYGAYSCQVSGHGTGIDNYNFWEHDVPSVSHQDTGYYDGIDTDQILVNKTWADVSTGRTGAGLWATAIVSPSAAQGRKGPIGTANTRIIDYFTISPGQSALEQGDPVQILFFAEINGSWLLQGYTGDGHQTAYRAQLWRGNSILSEMDYTTGGLYPPQDFFVNEKYLTVVDVNIGDTLKIDAQMHNWMNGSVHSPGTIETDYMDFMSSTIARIGYAPGYENIEIVSEAGAPIVIPQPDLMITDIWEVNGVLWYQVYNSSIVSCPAGHTTTLQVDGQPVDSDMISSILLPGQRLNRAFANYMWVCSQIEDAWSVTADTTQTIVEADEQNNTRDENQTCDSTAPVIIFGPVVDPNLNSARITWTTDEVSDSTVRYDSKAGFYGQFKTDVGLNTEHEVILENLTEGSLYHFIVESSGAAGNLVKSSEEYFQTDLGEDTAAPQVSNLTTMAARLPLMVSAQAADNAGVERVEFLIDGTHFATSYSTPHRVKMYPDLLGYTRTTMQGTHMMEARAHDTSGNTNTQQAAWFFDHPCSRPGAELYFWSPSEEEVIYTDETTAPPGQVEVFLHARRTLSIASMTDDSTMRDWHGDTPGSPGWVTMGEADVEFELDGAPITPPYLGEYLYMDGIISFDMDVTGLPLGPHTLQVRTTTDEGCVLSDTITLRVEHNPPNLEINRTVIRDGTSFTVHLDITNTGTSPANLDAIEDTMIGYQAFGMDNTEYIFSIISYAPEEKKCRIRVNFTGDLSNVLESGQTQRVTYTAVPILYNQRRFTGHRFGGEGTVDYHDSIDAYENDFNMVSFRDLAGHSILYATQLAISEADYLAVTNPHQLYRLYNDPEVNTLLASAARLTALRDGVLGFYYSYYTLYTSFEGSQLVDVGNLLNDLHDEIVLVDIGNSSRSDWIRAYDQTKDLRVEGQFPIDLGIEGFPAGDDIVVGDVINEEAGSHHPGVEILHIDGHSPSSLAGLGEVTIYKYLPATSTFTTEIFSIPDYEPYMKVFCADVYDPGGLGWAQDEILVAHEDGYIRYYIDLNETLSGARVTEYGPGDLIAVGNVLGDYREDIVVADLQGDRILVYESGSGGSGATLDYAVEIGIHDGLAVGDVIGNGMKEILLADHSDGTIRIYDFSGLPAVAPTIVSLPVRIEFDDHLIVADILSGGKGEVLLARGTHRAYEKGNIEILHIPDGQTYDDRYGLDELINEGGDWTEQLSASFLDEGYLLLIGETPIIPATSMNYSTESEDWKAYYSDILYASTTGDIDEPELAVGRIIGNNPAELQRVLDTSIDMAIGTFTLDNSDAYLCRGSNCGPGGTSACLDFTGGNAAVRALFNGHGFTTVSETLDGPAAITEADFFNHARDNDILFLAAHGGWNVWEDVNSNEVQTNFTPGTTRPFVHAMSCSTGQYPLGSSLAERFLQGGASAYIGGTSRLDFGGTQPLYELFYEYLNADLPIGKVFRDAKRTWVYSTPPDTSQTVIKYNCAANHLFGDPKLSFSGMWPSSPAPMTEKDSLPLNAPSTSLQISIPNVAVSEIDGEDWVRIPNHGMLLEPNKPMVPVYTHTLPLPSGLQVLDITMTGKGELEEALGLEIPMYTRGILEGGESSDLAESPEGEGWWPEREFDFKLVKRPNGETDLVLNIYPFFYHPSTTRSRFYKTYSFDITYHNSLVEINRLLTDKKIYEPGQSVKIDTYLYNPSEQGINVIAECVIRDQNFQIVDAMLLRTLRNLKGLAFYSMPWDSSNFPSGRYTIELTIRQTDGILLDRESSSVQIGSTEGKLTQLLVDPPCFDVNHPVTITTAFLNTGDVSVSGNVVIEIQTIEGIGLEEFQQSFDNLSSNSQQILQVPWTATHARGQCRIVAYAVYDGFHTPEEIFPLLEATETGDFSGDDQVNIEDMAFLALYWLHNEPQADIAPLGGDCIVNLQDLVLLLSFWLE